MWSSIVDRYRYVEAIDQALRGGLPAPEDLGVAFELMPQRPEVPFILMRASRTLSFDDRPENFFLYMDRFFSRVNKDSIVKRFKDFKRPSNVSIASEKPTLPVLDPIQQLVCFYIEKKDSADALKWAIDTLNRYRSRDDDKELILLRTRLEMEYAEITVKDIAKLRELTRKAISSIDRQTDPVQTKDAFRSLSFATDHVYQEALDGLAWLKADGPAALGGTTPACADVEEIAAIFQRILLLRKRMLTHTDLIWWRPPGKLSLYYLYLHFSGQRGKWSTTIYNAFDKCPGLVKRIKELYDAPAFKSFQDPEYWTHGTPFAPAFNGSAAITQLRQWLRLGW